MSLSTQSPQLGDLPPEVLSQVLTFCTADWWSIRQVNRRLKLAVAMEVRVIHIRPQLGSQAEAEVASSPAATVSCAASGLNVGTCSYCLSTQSQSSEFFSVSKRCRALVQIWLTAFPMDSTPLVDARPSMLRSLKHCDDLVVAGNLAAVTYAEANLPSFLSGENGCMTDMLS